MILAYHRVTETPTDPQLLCVSPRHFAEQLLVLRRVYRPMPLLELATSFREGRMPDRAVVVTFDDGYADNLHEAAPLLAAQGVPATVFVVPGEREGEFWWDELDRLLLQPGTLPQMLQLEVNDEAQEWDLGGAAEYSPADFERYRAWSVLQADAPTPRQAAYRSLHQALRPLATSSRKAILDSLRAWSGAGKASRPTHRRLGSAEIVRLAEAGIEVGGHTLTHPVLSALPVEQQQTEISLGKRRLEGILGRPVRSFAYPYGARKDYTVETVEIVRQAGFVCACANYPGMAQIDTDVFQLPRILVRDWDGDEFARRIRTEPRR